MQQETQNDGLAGLDVPRLRALATALGIGFIPAAREGTLCALIRCAREQNAERARARALEPPSPVPVARPEPTLDEVLADCERRRARAKRVRANPELRAEFIERRADRLRGDAERVRCFVRGIDAKHPCYDPDGTDADYLRNVQLDAGYSAKGVEVAHREVAKADAMRDGLPSKPGRQIVARARLQLAEAEHELASARLYAATTSDPVQAPARRKLMLRGRP
jgi:hypothetical protein